MGVTGLSRAGLSLQVARVPEGAREAAFHWKLGWSCGARDDLTLPRPVHAVALHPRSLAQASWKQLASRREHTEAVSLPFKACSWKPQNVTVATFSRHKPNLKASLTQGEGS